MTLLSPEAEAFVRAARVGRLASVDERGRPHVVPVCFAYEDGVAYSVLDEKPKRVGDRELQRVRNLRANPSVQLLIDHYDEDWRRLAYVQLRGRASLLEGGPEHATVLRLLRAKYPRYLAMALESRPMIRIVVERAITWGRLPPGVP